MILRSFDGLRTQDEQRPRHFPNPAQPEPVEGRAPTKVTKP